MRTIGAVGLGLAVALAVALPAGPPVKAQTDQQYDWCEGKGDVPEDVQISACTAIITSGRLKGSELAWAYYHRGVSFGQIGQYGRALGDLDQSIRLDPGEASSWWMRHAIKEEMGDLSGAEADYRKALQLDPNIDRKMEGGQPAQPTTGSYCARLPGVWSWFIGGDVTINPDGTLAKPSGKVGTWTCTNDQVVMLWDNGWTDRLTFSRDGNRISGSNGLIRVWGKRKL